MSFSTDINSFVNETIKKLGNTSDKAIFTLCDLIINKTPVDTSRCKRSWTPSLNVISSWGLIELTNEEALKIKKTKYIDRVSPELEQMNLGDTFFMANETPYINYLEYGGISRQAPNGMVRINVAKWRQIVDGSVN
jgi:hypothetical protein